MTAPASPEGPRSGSRGLWLRRLALALTSTLLLLEPAGCVAWTALTGHRFSYGTNLEAEARALLDASAANPNAPRFAATEEVVHPFLGFVLDPTFRRWARSSREMDALCRGVGCEYWHFLQPNQYDPGSKRLAQEERSLVPGEGEPRSSW